MPDDNQVPDILYLRFEGAKGKSNLTFSSLIFFIQVSEELIRVAILWHEMWHEGLEEASRLYFGERNVKGMFAVLEPLHAMMERGPQTLKETSFNQVRVVSVISCTSISSFVLFVLPSKPNVSVQFLFDID